MLELTIRADTPEELSEAIRRLADRERLFIGADEAARVVGDAIRNIEGVQTNENR